MRTTIRTLFNALILTPALFLSTGLVGEGLTVKGQEASQNRPTPADNPGNTDEASAQRTPETEPRIWIHLVGGGKIEVDELTESADGVWYKRGIVSTFLDRARLERIERESDLKLPSKTDALQGSGRWKISDAGKVEGFFMATFGRRLPVAAFGQSELHTRWGLDHRNGMDVPLHPDSPEGRALIKFLRAEEIPFIAFRGPVPRVSTGPHIHIGHRSPRIGSR